MIQRNPAAHMVKKKGREKVYSHCSAGVFLMRKRMRQCARKAAEVRFQECDCQSAAS